MSVRQTGRTALRARKSKLQTIRRAKRRRLLWLEHLDERAMFVVYLSDGFANNSQGWTLGPEWQIGPATSSSGQDTGFSDPATDTTPTADNGVAGVVIGGNASVAVHGPYYMTSPVMNTVGAPNLTFSYNRWLNSDFLPYMDSTIDVFDGSTWVNIYATGVAGQEDNSWVPQSFNLLPYSNANLQIRFGVVVGDPQVYAVSSWNIDDVLVQSVVAQSIPFTEDFSDNSAGWTLGNEWQIGPAAASSGHDAVDGHGPDPGTDTTPTADNGIAGVVIGGNATISVHGFYYLTSPVIDTTGAPSLALQFNRWLNSDYTPYMESVIEVFNGSTWTTIYTNGGNPVSDTSWVAQSFDITAYSNASLQVRFGHRVGDPQVWVVSGWNIDDVFIGAPLNNNNFSNAFLLPPLLTTQGTGSNAGFSAETGEPTAFPAASPPVNSAWWTWTAPVSGIVQIDTIGSNFDTTLGVYTGAAVNALTLIASNDDFSGVQSGVSFNAVAGTAYRIQVDGFGAATGNIVVNVQQVNDLFARAFTLTGLNVTTTANNTGSAGEPGEPNNAGTSAPLQSLWWSWTAPASGLVEINTIGSPLDTTLGVYTGNAVNSLTLVASNDDIDVGKPGEFQRGGRHGLSNFGR